MGLSRDVGRAGLIKDTKDLKFLPQTHLIGCLVQQKQSFLNHLHNNIKENLKN